MALLPKTNQKFQYTYFSQKLIIKILKMLFLFSFSCSGGRATGDNLNGWSRGAPDLSGWSKRRGELKNLHHKIKQNICETTFLINFIIFRKVSVPPLLKQGRTDQCKFADKIGELGASGC